MHVDRIAVDKRAPRPGARPWLLVYAVLAAGVALAFWF
jgi:hypothetical protein